MRTSNARPGPIEQRSAERTKEEPTMSGTTRTIQQPAGTGSILAVIVSATVVLAAAVAIAWGSTNLDRATVVVPRSAPIFAPAVRDLGARDVVTNSGKGLAVDKVHDRGWSQAAAVRGFGPAGNQLKDDGGATKGSSSGAPAARHAGPRAS